MSGWGPATIAAASVAVAAAAAAVVTARPAPGRRLRPVGRRSSPGRLPAGRLPAGRLPARPGSAARPAVPAEAVLELVASALDGGASVDRALAAVAEALQAVGDPGGDALRGLVIGAGPGQSVPGERGPSAEDAIGSPASVLSAVLGLALATGCAPAALLRSAAADRRRRRAAEQARRARRLGVLVLLPTGGCLLPAFVLLTVVPLVLDLLAQALG